MCDKNPKQEKRKEMPKKPMTAYFLFCSDKRKENKDKKISPKELSEMYDHLPESEKERYKKIHQELMKKYEEEMALFMSNNLEDEEKDIKKAKAKSLKSDQNNNNKNACNCGNCDECLKINKK